MWLELVFKSHRFEIAGTALEVFTPYELTAPVIIGTQGAYQWLRLTPAETSLVLDTMRGHVLVNRTELRVGQLTDLTEVTLRVIAGPRASCGFPAGLEWPPGPWSDEMLQVLGDQLLDLGFDVGTRFVSRDSNDDTSWLGAFGPRVAKGEARATWRFGVLDSLIVKPWAIFAMPMALAQQAICRPLRTLDLRGGYPEDVASAVEMLISLGGLPCLERLICTNEDGQRDDTIESGITKLAGLHEAFPMLSTESE